MRQACRPTPGLLGMRPAGPRGKVLPQRPSRRSPSSSSSHVSIKLFFMYVHVHSGPARQVFSQGVGILRAFGPLQWVPNPLSVWPASRPHFAPVRPTRALKPTALCVHFYTSSSPHRAVSLQGGIEFNFLGAPDAIAGPLKSHATGPRSFPPQGALYGSVVCFVSECAAKV